MKWLLSGNRASLYFAIFLSVLAFLFAGALMFTSGYMISLAACIPFTVLALHIPSLFVRIFGIGKPILQYCHRLFSHDWVLKMTSRLRLCLYDALRKKTSILQSRETTSRILMMLTDDIGHAQDIVLRAIMPISSAWALAIVVSLAAGALSLPLAIVLFSIMALSCVVLPLAIAKSNMTFIEKQKLATSDIYDKLTDGILGIEDWRLSGRHDDFKDGIMSLFNARAEIEERILARRRACAFIAQVLFCLCVLSLIAWAAIAFAPALQGGISSGFAEGSFANTANWLVSDLADALGRVTQLDSEPYAANWIAAFALCFFPLIEAFSQVEIAAETYMRQKDPVDELVEYMGDSAEMDESDLDTKSSRHANAEAAASPASHIEPASPTKPTTPTEPVSKISPAPPLDIRAHDLSFSYGDNEVLSKVDLDIPYGSKVAIVGKSGAGKTTLLSLIHGDLVPSNGFIEIADASPEDLEAPMHEIMTIVGQFPYLFDMSLRENLKIANPRASDSEIINALESVGLQELLKRTLDNQITDQGFSLSGGERQRVALARAFIADAPIVILDEPFANLDEGTESEILDVIFDIFSEKTVIIVTHRQDNLDRFDQIVRL